MTSSITDGSTPVVPDQIVGYAAARQSRHVFNDIVGGGQDVATAPAGLRTGTMTALFIDYDPAAALHGLLSGESVLTFADSDRPYLGMTFLVDGSATIALEEVTNVVWLVTFDYHEVTP